MKKMVQTIEVEGEGFLALMNERVTLFCANFIYTGKLVGVNETCVLLEDAGIVYETGPYTEKNWKDYQKFPGKTWYVRLSAIESFGVCK